jgi:spore germination protein
MKRGSIFLSVVLLVTTIGVSIFSYSIYKEKEDYKIYLQNQYQRILYDLASNVDNVEVSLSKALIANSKEQKGVLFGDIWNDANSAHYKLNALPINHLAISNTSKFLSQVSDYSYAMLKQNSLGVNPTKEQIGILQKLKDYSGYVTIKLREYVDEIGYNGIALNELNRADNQYVEVSNLNVNDAISNLNDQIQQYPTLLYDGPFSENVLNIKPKVLSEKKITMKKAEKIVEEIIGKSEISEIKLNQYDRGGKIPTFSFDVKRKGMQDADVNIDVTKNGGKILSMLNARSIGNEKLDIKQAIKMGLKFLENNNYKAMVPTYTLKYDGVLVVNYVKKYKDILLYPDQIKLKIALDNGGIVGVESKQFLTASYERKISKPKLKLEEANKKINAKLNVKNSRITLIPMESLREVLCYEFYGEYQGEHYFVYINASDGTEERILKVINTANGELTM